VAETSTIEWTHATWSPWEGCTKVSPGCDHCYAEGMNRWLRKGENWGPGAPRRGYSDAHWEKPLRWNDKAKAEGRSLRVFPSVCDPFDNEVDPAWRARFFALIAGTPHLTWLLLTKRIGNVKAMLPADWGDGYPNVWIGATVVNQEEADRDIPKLLATPARVRFLSIEPMLGSVDLRLQRPVRDDDRQDLDGWCSTITTAAGAGIKWVIVGSESGHHARRDPAMIDWVRSLKDQCVAAGVAFLWKQDAERGRKIPTPELDGRTWVEFPRLHGVAHDGFPEQAR
jgi:protein gp37